MKLYKDKFCEIEYYEEIPCINWKLAGSPSRGQFKNYVQDGIDHFNKYKETKEKLSFIINIRDFDPENEKEIDIDWVNEDIMTMLYFNRGIQNVALISSNFNNAKNIEKEFFDKTEQLHRIKIINSHSEALLWLRDCNEQTDIGNYKIFFNQQ